MAFDWMRAVEKNRDDLIEIVTRLFLLAGIRSFARVTVLPRSRRLRILSILRPAEYAARRLIAVAACGLEWGIERQPARTGTPQQQPPTQAGTRVESGERSPIPAFALFDPLKPYSSPWVEEEDDDIEPDWPEFFLPPDEPVDARPVCRRILALEAALQDLEGQARRLARWRARRQRETARPRRWQPMRPGLPPGWRKRPKTAVEEVLKECHSLALYAWTAPDTS